MTAKKRDMTGAKEAIKVSRWIEPWGDSRFPIDVDGMAKNCHSTYDRDDPITEIHGAPWKDVDGFLRRNPDNPRNGGLPTARMSRRSANASPRRTSSGITSFTASDRMNSAAGATPLLKKTPAKPTSRHRRTSSRVTC